MKRERAVASPATANAGRLVFGAILESGHIARPQFFALNSCRSEDVGEERACFRGEILAGKADFKRG